MKLKVEIEVGEDGVLETDEAAELLRRVASVVDSRTNWPHDVKAIRDAKGDVVGHWEVCTL